MVYTFKHIFKFEFGPPIIRACQIFSRLLVQTREKYVRIQQLQREF